MHDPHTEALLARVTRAAELMAARIDAGEPVRLDELADAAALSKFHFHRVFRLLTGEAPGEAVRRLRLAHAVAGLRDPQARITQVAHEAGFASSQALAKAMRQALDASPSDLRSEPERLDAAFTILAAPAAPGALTLEVAHTPGFDVLVMRHIGDPVQLHGVYGFLFEHAGGPENVSALLGFQHDDVDHVPAEDQVYDAALAVLAPPADLVSPIRATRAEPRRWLRLHHVGGYGTLEPEIDRLTLIALAAGVEPADAPLMLHYLDDPDEVAEADQRADIYLPIA